MLQFTFRMKLLKKHISRRHFLKGGLISGLAALGLVSLSGCGLGGGAIPYGTTVSGIGESGDDPEVQPESGGTDTTQASNNVEYVEVWKVDPLYDSSTGDKVGYFDPTNGNNHFPARVYNDLRGIADRYLFRFDTNPKGRYACPGLRKLNWRFDQALVAAGIPSFKPMLVSFMMRKDIADVLFGSGRYIDRYADPNITKVQEYLFDEIYSDDQELVIW